MLGYILTHLPDPTSFLYQYYYQYNFCEWLLVMDNYNARSLDWLLASFRRLIFSRMHCGFLWFLKNFYCNSAIQNTPTVVENLFEYSQIMESYNRLVAITAGQNAETEKAESRKKILDRILLSEILSVCDTRGWTGRVFESGQVVY